MNMLSLLAAETGAGILAGNLLWILLLVVGFGLVIVEVYLPGFGAPGILGGICLLAGVAVRARTDVMTWIVMLLIVAAVLCVVVSLALRLGFKGRLEKSRLVLHEVAGKSVEESDLAFYVGKTGVTTTVLRPAGNAEIEGVKLNVTSDAEFIPEGEKVIVKSVEGNKIVVKRV